MVLDWQRWYFFFMNVFLLEMLTKTESSTVAGGSHAGYHSTSSSKLCSARLTMSIGSISHWLFPLWCRKSSLSLYHLFLCTFCKICKALMCERMIATHSVPIELSWDSMVPCHVPLGNRVTTNGGSLSFHDSFCSKWCAKSMVPWFVLHKCSWFMVHAV